MVVEHLRGTKMLDVLFISITILSFLIALAYVRREKLN